MGSASSLVDLQEEIDHETFKRVCGDRYSAELFQRMKNERGMVSSAALQVEARKTHVFLSHCWGEDEHGRDNHQRVGKVNAWLQKHKVIPWYDVEQMEGNVMQRMAEGIDNTCIVLVFVTKQYIEKVAGKGPKGQNDSCSMEFNYAVNRGVKMLAIVHDKGCRNPKTWTGPVGLSMASNLYYDNTDDEAFEDNMQRLLVVIQGMIPQHFSTVANKAGPPVRAPVELDMRVVSAFAKTIKPFINVDETIR